jgi:ATP-dependent 26S proteasome regulatory subunit
MNTELCPAQQTAFDKSMAALETTTALVVAAPTGSGRTTLLRALHSALGGTFLGAREILEASRDAHPLALDETVHALIARALAASDVVIVDDFHTVVRSVAFCGSYPRSGFIAQAMSAVTAQAEDAGKTLILGAEFGVAASVLGQIDRVMVGEFTPDDFAHLCTSWLGGDVAGRLDFAKIHRFAPRLTARQLRRSCERLMHESQPIDTDRFMAHLADYHLVSNVNLAEVQDVALSDLRGMEEVLDALEANIVFPLENAELAAELRLRPKRGVLLAGPPGTGKTTIGRALARRLKGKFFLLDGTVVVGTPEFYQRIQHVFQLAKDNGPAVIFIDDSDVIFEQSGETGFYRYLLTMLDGIESESPGQICVIMTAMDVGNLPPALVRSGRIELWLETRLPDVTARAQILADRCSELPASVGAMDIGRVAEATEGVSGADLKRMVEDGKLLHGYDRSRNLELKSFTDYVLSALDTVRANKERYAAASARALESRPNRPSHFQFFEALAAESMAMGGEMMPGEMNVFTVAKQ